MNPALYSPTRYIHLLLQCLEDEQVDGSAVLQAFEVDRAVLAHPETQMAPLKALALFRALADRHPGSDIGLKIGMRVTYGVLGDAGRAMLTCGTLLEALRCCAEFYPLIAPSLRLQVRQHGTCTELMWIPARPMPFDFMRIAYDMAIGAMDAMLGAVLAERMPGYDVFFSFTPPPHVARYGRLTHARCHWNVPGLPCLRLQIDNEALRAPMPLANPHELAVLRERLVQRLSPAPMQGQWTSWVSMLLEEAHGEQPGLGALAGLVHVSPSTLARHLAAEGTTFRQLSSEIRHRRACRWLQEGQMMVTEISERLGYADLPSFVRAFKAISGVSPSRFVA